MPDDWRGMSAELPAAWRVEAPDLWEELADGPCGLAELGGRLNRRVVPGGRNLLVGYSLGGRIALHALLAEGAGVWDAAVLVSAHPGLEDARGRELRRQADAAWAARAEAGAWEDFLDAWQDQPVLTAGGAAGGWPLADRARLAGRRREIARSFGSWSLGAQEPLWGRLPEIRVPVLWVTGGRDAKFRALAERAVPLLPRGRAWVADGAGHRVPWDASAAFAEQVRTFSGTC